MKRRPDGRLYSKVTRRCKSILELMEKSATHQTNDLVDLVQNQATAEFFLTRFNKVMSAPRMRVYVRYLIELNAVESDDGSLKRLFRLRNSDEQWAQALADQARRHIAREFEIAPGDVWGMFSQRYKELLGNDRIPTLSDFLSAAGVVSGQGEEYIRWSIYMMCDGFESRVAIRRIPTIWVNTEKIDKGPHKQ